MQKIIDETEKAAYVYLKAFGFEENEIVPVVEKGLSDLENTLNKLRTLLASPEKENREKMDDILHALKGLLFQMGNHELAENIEALRGCEDRQKLYNSLNNLLF